MIGKVAPRGQRVGGLLAYLFGPGRAEEHVNPHVVNSWLGTDVPEGLDQILALMQAPLDYTPVVPDRHVWHCSMRVAPEDRTLSDAEWAQVATDLARRVGLDPGDGSPACPWVAVRHADHHIHIAAVLAREDGTVHGARGDYRHVREACLAAEQRYGLRSTTPTHKGAHPRPSRAEVGKAEREGRHRTPRDMLRIELRTAAAASISDEGFVEHLEHAGLTVDLRHSTVNDGQITGYSVGWPGDRSADGAQIMYGGSKLAKDLSWPRLQQRWAIDPARGDPWLAVTRAADQAINELRQPDGDAGHVAAAVADMLDAAAWAEEGRRNGPWRQAATRLRTAHPPSTHRATTPTTAALWTAAAALSLHRGRRSHDTVAAAALRVVALMTLLNQQQHQRRREQDHATQPLAAYAPGRASGPSARTPTPAFGVAEAGQRRSLR